MFGTARFNKRGYPTFIVLNVMPVVLFCAVFLYGQVAHAQNLAPEKLDSLVFAVGEEVHYDVLYTWGFLQIKAGKVQFKVQQTPQQQADSIYHLKSIGLSLPRYDWIFQVRDTFESWVQMPAFKPLYYRRSTHEGNYSVQNSLQLEPPYIISHRQNSRTALQVDSMAYVSDRFDLQTAVYFVRQIDFSRLKEQDIVSLNVIIDGTPYNMSIQNLGLETVKQKGEKYDCYHLVTDVIEGSIFKPHQKIDIWLSADKQRIPIKVEAPIIVGRVHVELDEVIGN